MGARQAGHHQVARQSRVGLSVGGAQDEMTVQAGVAGGDCGRARVVALNSADRDQGVGALGQGVRDQKLELAYLVARQVAARQVVPLRGRVREGGGWRARALGVGLRSPSTWGRCQRCTGVGNIPSTKRDAGNGAKPAAQTGGRWGCRVCNGRAAMVEWLATWRDPPPPAG